jgi:hypothetical protein
VHGSCHREQCRANIKSEIDERHFVMLGACRSGGTGRLARTGRAEAADASSPMRVTIPGAVLITSEIRHVTGAVKLTASDLQNTWNNDASCANLYGVFHTRRH